jgi:hypothetical protein
MADTHGNKRGPRTRESYIAEAVRICKKHGGVFFTVKRDVFRVYRRSSNPEHHAPIFLGERSTPATFLSLVRNVTGSTDAAPKS